MEIIKLGCYGRYAPPHGATSGFLIKTDVKIVIDLGSGCLSKLLEYEKIEDVDALILTHLHFDHCADALTLIYLLEKTNIELNLYLPKTPSNIRDLFLACKKFKIHDLPCEEICFKQTKIIPLFSPHTVETYGIKINYQEDVLYYSSDCSDEKILKINAEGANIVIGDACILDREHIRGMPHLSVKALACNIPNDSLLYLAHLTYEQEEEILQEAQTFHKNSKFI